MNYKGFNILVFLILSTVSHSQKLKVDDVNPDFKKTRNSSHFDCINDSLSNEYYTWVADYTIKFDSVYPGKIKKVFEMFKAKANKMGANSFIVKNSDIYPSHEHKFISISAYWLKMEDRNYNHQLFKESKVYLFGFLGHHRAIEGYRVRLNEEDFIMSELRYRSFLFKPGKQIDLIQGSNMRGDKRSFVMEDNQYPRYFFFNKVTGAFKNSFIGEYDMNFGEFLLRILDVQN